MGDLRVDDLPGHPTRRSRLRGGVRPDRTSCGTDRARRQPADGREHLVRHSRRCAACAATWTSDVSFLYQRIHDAAGAFVGVLELSRPAIPESISARLSRGNTAMFERMNALREPVRRSAGILFADLEASGELSRTLSSRAYFELIRASHRRHRRGSRRPRRHHRQARRRRRLGLVRRRRGPDGVGDGEGDDRGCADDPREGRRAVA